MVEECINQSDEKQGNHDGSDIENQNCFRLSGLTVFLNHIHDGIDLIVT